MSEELDLGELSLKRKKGGRDVAFFAVFDCAGYAIPDSQNGLPSVWYQYALYANGSYAALCFNPIVDGFHRCDCK